MIKVKKYNFEDIFLGSRENTTLPERVFNAVTGLSCVVSFVSMMSNFIFLTRIEAVISFLSMLVTGAIYFYSRKTRKYQKMVLPQCLFLVIVITLAWMYGFGTFGNTTFYLFIAVMAADVALEERYKNLFLFFVLGVVTILLFHEFLYPPSLPAIASNLDGRLGDAAISIYLGIFIIVLVTRIIVHQHARDKEEIALLRQFLPICAYCKKIRDDKGYWNQLERYISTHSTIGFTHSICPECLEKFYNDKKHRPATP